MTARRKIVATINATAEMAPLRVIAQSPTIVRFYLGSGARHFRFRNTS